MRAFQGCTVPRSVLIALGAVVVLAACGTVDSSAPLDSTTRHEETVASTTVASSPVPESTGAPQNQVVAGDLGDQSLVAIDPVAGTTRWTAGDTQLASLRTVLALDDIVIGFGSDCGGLDVEAAWDRTSGVELWRTEPWRTAPSDIPNYGWTRSLQFGEIEGTVTLPRPGSVLGVEPSSGMVRWTFVPERGVVIGVAPAAEVFVIATSEGPGDTTYHGIDPATGATRWSTTLDGNRFNGAFVAGDDIVVVPGFDANGAVMLALDADDGATLWEAPAAAGSDRVLPYVLDSDVVVAMAPDGIEVIGLDPGTGAQLWQLAGSSLPEETSWSVEVGLPRPGAAHVVSSEGVSLLDSATGDVIWTTTWAELGTQDSWGFGGTTVEGDALFASPTADDPTRVELMLLDRSKATVWQTLISDVGSIMGDGIANRSDVFLLRRCPGD